MITDFEKPLIDDIPDARRDDEIIEGLTLLKKYDDTGFGVCAEHDIITAGPDSYDDVTAEDVEILESLNWIKDTESGRWGYFV